MTREPDQAQALRRLLVDPVHIAHALGLDEGAKRQPNGLMVCCPWHSERTPSCSITRGSDGTLRAHCFGCGAGGDVLHLIAQVRGLDHFARVIEEAGNLAGTIPPTLRERVSRTPRESLQRAARSVPESLRQSRPPREKVEALWNACLPVNRTIVDPAMPDLAPAFFLARRGLYAPRLAELDLARVTPAPETYSWPRWWPKTWASTWRLIVPAYDPNGNVTSVHARAVVQGADPKTRWPRGCRADGLLFADTRGLALLRGQPGDTDRVVIVEGLTDFLRMSLAVADEGRRHAVVGITSGSLPAFSQVKWPAHVPLIVGTDPDEAGDKYAQAIREAVPSKIEVRRWRPQLREVR